jgi:hypothetical protein
MKYSLFIMEIKDDVDGGEGATGSGSGNISPFIIAVYRSVLRILCFHTVFIVK